MTILNQLRASGGNEAIVNTLELRCEAWPSSFYLCDGFIDYTIRIDGGQPVEAVATGMAIALPKKDASGAQSLRFALENLRGEVSKAVQQALDDLAQVELIYRGYVTDGTSTILGDPVEPPITMIVRQCAMIGASVEITAGFFDLIDTQFPRDVYDSEFAPGLKYL